MSRKFNTRVLTLCIYTADAEAKKGLTQMLIPIMMADSEILAADIKGGKRCRQ
jgi:hypothetical protein